MTRYPRHLARGALLLPLLVSAIASAQIISAPSTPAAAAGAGTSDETVKLSEFQVNADDVHGYVASETMTGSRINTKIVDLPYSIVNLTSEFFRDFNVQFLDENMTYIGGLTGVNIGGGFNLRGFAATSQLRDGFYRLGRYGLSNIDRLEIIRGPNAAIYGRSSPGGMINMVSIQPKQADAQELTFSEGSYKQGLGTLDLTGSIDKAQKTYYVISLNQTYRSYPGEYDQLRNNEDYFAIRHDFSDNSHLEFTAEYFLQIQHAPQSSVPTISVARTATPDNAATSTFVGYDYALSGINAYGPNSELNRGSGTVTLTYDKEFNDIWSTRVGFYRFGARRWDYNQNTGWGSITIPAAAGSAITTTRGSIPSRGEIMEDGGGFQADLVAHYFLASHKVEAKTLFTVDFNDYYRWDPTWEFGPTTNPTLQAWGAAGSGRVVTLVPGTYKGQMTLIPNAPIAYFPSWYNPADLTDLVSPAGGSTNGGTLTRRRTSSIGGNIRQQMFFFENRLIVYGGVRNDTVLFSQRDYTVAFASVGFGDTLAPGTGGANQPGGSVVRRYEHQNKPNAGFNYAVTKDDHLRVYGSYSTAYFVDQTSRPAVIASSTYAPFTAKGYDYGIKGSYFDERLNFTVGGYYANEYNVLVTDTVEQPPGSGNFVDLAEQDGDQLVRGFEFDVSWQFNDAIIFGASGAEVNAKYTNFGSAFPEVKGRSVNGISPENGSLYGKYSIVKGSLTGLSFNVLTTYVASTPSQAPNTGDTTAIVNGVSVVTGHTDGWKSRYPSFEIWNAGIHYQLPLLSRNWGQEISFNVNNIFNKFYIKTTGQIADGRNVLFLYTLTHVKAH